MKGNVRGAAWRAALGGAQLPDLSDDAHLEAVPLVIPVGSEMGWEVAVFDHFRAVSNAIAAKVRCGSARSAEADDVGGATLSFLVGPGHPFWDRVHSLLGRVRADVNTLWRELEAYNAEHVLTEQGRTTIWFYVGQYVEKSGEEGEGAA